VGASGPSVSQFQETNPPELLMYLEDAGGTLGHPSCSPPPQLSASSDSGSSPVTGLKGVATVHMSRGVAREAKLGKG